MTIYNTPYGLGEASKVLDDTWALVDVETQSGQPLLVHIYDGVHTDVLSVFLHALLYNLHFDS